MDVGLFHRYTGPFYRYTGLFCGYSGNIRLFCEWALYSECQYPTISDNTISIYSRKDRILYIGSDIIYTRNVSFNLRTCICQYPTISDNTTSDPYGNVWLFYRYIRLCFKYIGLCYRYVWLLCANMRQYRTLFWT